jgi:surfeit locus 1 family protein
MNRVPRGPVTDGAAAARPAAARWMLGFSAALLFAVFAALGTWQIQRLHWKLDLIERVNQRVHAPAMAAPGRARWPQIDANADEYRHVSLSGTFLYARTTRVQAVTELGAGFWLLTPLRQADGDVVLVNRGFIPAASAAEARNPGGPAGTVAVTGLLRISEPGGAFLRHNDPASDRWYSRDVQAIAAARGLPPVAPYFVDADASGIAGGSGADAPIGGLTVIAFHNNHLVYALTWYALALMVAGACWWGVREQRKSQRRIRGADRIDRESEDGKKN